MIGVLIERWRRRRIAAQQRRAVAWLKSAESGPGEREHR